MSETTPLKDDLLNGVRAIAQYTGETERRVRLMIDFHGLPYFKKGGRIYSRKSWLDRWYSPDAGDQAA